MGKDETFSLLSALKASAVASQEHLRSLEDAFRASGEVEDPDEYMDSAGRLTDAMDAFTDGLDFLPEEGFALQARTSDGRLLLLTAAASKEGHWQLTRFDRDEQPWGDTRYPVRGKGIKEFLSESNLATVTTVDCRLRQPGALEATPAGISIEQAVAVVDRVREQYAYLPTVRVYQTPMDRGVPGALRHYIQSQKAEKTTEGAIYGGEIYLFAAHLSNEAQAEFVLAEHEVTHHGMRGVFGPELDPILRFIHDNNASVRTAASRMSGLTVEAATEEVLADMPSEKLPALKGWRRLAHAVADGLYRLGFKKTGLRINDALMGSLDAEARADVLVGNVVRAARAWVRSGRSMLMDIAHSALSASLRAVMPGEVFALRDGGVGTVISVEQGQMANVRIEGSGGLFEQIRVDTLKTLPRLGVADVIDGRFFTPSDILWLSNSRTENPALRRVWHGTPFQFDRFSAKHIDRVNGLNYGHGFYFTDRRELADEYRSIGARAKRGFFFDDIDYTDEGVGVAAFAEKTGLKPVVARCLLANNTASPEKLRGFASRMRESKFDWERAGAWCLDDAASWLEQNESRVRVGRTGAVLEVEIPDGDCFLHWGRPLSDHPEEARAAIRAAVDSMLGQNTDRVIATDIVDSLKDGSATGEQLYSAMSRLGDRQSASQALRGFGLVGIRYKDMERDGEPDGYVVFDEADLSIEARLRRNDLFADDFVAKDAVIHDEVIVSSKGATELVARGNEDSRGRQIAGFKQGLRNFWNWFAGSEVVNSDGKPLLLFHGTRSNVDAFEVGRETVNMSNLGFEWTTSRAGIFATPNLEFAESFAGTKDGGNVMPIYMDIKNPVDLRLGLSCRLERELTDAGYNTRLFYASGVQLWEFFDEENGGFEFVEALKKAGYDGAISAEDDDAGVSQTCYIAFDPSQIKSAIGNCGRYNAQQNDIRLSRGSAPGL